MVVLDAGGGCRGNLTRWCGVGNQSDSRTATPAGTYTPAVTVNSAGPTASTNFTLVFTE